jgi:hypothetical protein
MHRDRDDPNSETAALRLYMDESGGDDPNTPHAVIGGMLIFRRAFLLFEEEWDRMLVDHGIPEGIHMKEFGRPHGRLAKMSDCCRRELFIEVCYLIQKYRAVTLAATLSNEEYKANIPKAARDKYSVYAMCFDLTVIMNHKLAEANNYQDPIPFILDSGNPYKHHIVQAHGFMQKRFQKFHFVHLGSLTFDDDRALGILQAADVIAWGTRRRVSGIAFGPGFAPIEKLLTSDESHHTEIPWKTEWLREFGTSLAKIISSGEKLEIPTDEDIRELGD